MNNANPPVRESNMLGTRGEVLEYFGLNRNDLKVYNAVLQFGRTKTGPVIKMTHIASSRVYASLFHLTRKGLITYQVRNNVKYYQAELPDQLIEEVEGNTERLRTLSRELKKFPILPYSRNETNTYEGIRGFKMAYEQHIAGMQQHESACIMTFIGSEFTDSQNLRSFFARVIDPMMIKNKCKARMITSATVRKIISTDRPNPAIYAIKTLSERYSLPYSLNISQHEVLMSVWSDEPIVFSIKNPTVVKAFRKNFDFLWAIAKKK